MNPCDMGRRLSAYYDGEPLSADPARAEAERADLEAHLATCPHCRAELARLGRLSALLAEAGRGARLPERARERLHRRLEAASAAEVGRVAKAALAAAAAVLLACGLWLWQADGTEAAEPLPLWETVAAQQEGLAAGSQEQLAQWILQDLERTNHDD